MLHQLLRELRTRAGLTVPEVVERAGFPRSTVYLWETAPGRPSPEELKALLDLYAATPEERLQAYELRADPPSATPVP